MFRAFRSVLFLFTVCATPALGDQTIYTDSLQNGWASWGWATTIDFSDSTTVHAGSHSIAVTIGSAWQAIYLHHSAFNSGVYTHLGFWIHGGTSGGQRLQVQAELDGQDQTAVPLDPLTAGMWREVIIPLSSLGAANKTNLDGFWIQDANGSSWPAFYLDDVKLISGPSIVLTAPQAGASFAAPACIECAASVTANGHEVNRVDFLANGSLVGSASTAPYTRTWSNVIAGTYSLTGRLVYDGNATVDSSPLTVVVATNSSVSILVDAQRNRHPINPLIYGVAFASSNALAELNASLNRSGGNSETRYNWQINAHNRGADWYFESIGDTPATAGAAADDFVINSRHGQAEAMLSVPMIGWAPKLGSNRGKLASYSIAKYGPQTGSDSQWMPDAGNGISSTNGNRRITWNDPRDANTPVDSAFQAAWLTHLISKWGATTNGGVRFYCTDNEPSLWHSTHQDVHPTGATMREIRDKMFEYAAMVKNADANALVVGPEEWGWMGYFYSGYDQEWSAAHSDWNPAHFPDRGTNSGMDYIPWLLSQFRTQENNAKRRLLDYCTVHVYPQAGEFGNDVSTSMQLTRNRSTRQLWDTNYVDPTWIGSVVKLIPRMKEWVANYYPGTRIGITEYNWGAENHINGATAQADILGIFGREGLDLATRWTTPSVSSPTFKAMKMFRNYDGADSSFGDVSVYASGPNPDNVSVFSSVRSTDRALTLMVINKQLTAAAAVNVTITNQVLSGTGQVWQLTGANAIQRLTDISFRPNNFSNSVPPQSVTLYILAPGPVVTPTLRVAALTPGTSFELWVDGASGQRYVLDSTSDLANWSAIQTNTSTSDSLRMILPIQDQSRTFYRVRLTD